MLLSRRIPRLYRRLDYLLHIIADVEAAGGRSPEQVYTAERALIQIQVEWEHFVRGLILDSATGRFFNLSGRVISRSHADLHSREMAAHRLMAAYPSRRHEPDWYLPAEAIRASIHLDVSNQSQIAAELGVTPWPIEDLRHLRNFIAHRSKRSALRVRRSGIVGASDRIDVLGAAFQYSASGVQRYIEWISFSKAAAARLVV